MNIFHTLRLIAVILVVAALSVVSLYFYQYRLYFCLLFTGLGIVVLIACACRWQQRSTKLILRMVESLRYNDFALSFSSGTPQTPIEQLRWEINEVITDFRRKLAAQQEQYRYYETLLDTVDCCLIVTDKAQRIRWMNKAAVYDLLGHAIHSTEELGPLNPDFPHLLATLLPGEVKVIRLHREDFIQDMAATVTVYTTSEEEFRLINLKNIRSVLEENEVEAWQKLIHVLTHEIMNSIAPIVSLSDTLADRLTEADRNRHDDEMISQGMKAIHRRSKGLQEFVTNYRKLAYLTPPTLNPVRIGELLGDLRKLYPDGSITYTYHIEDENFILWIDRVQVEQVLINLLKNAAEACEGRSRPRVRITTLYQPEKRIFRLTVADNGCGILPTVQEKIFVPFYTTKTTGSGIGLSLCKQIMTLHGGSISVVSKEAEGGAAFILKFLYR